MRSRELASRDRFSYRDARCSQHGELRVRADGSLSVDPDWSECPAGELTVTDSIELARAILRRASPELVLVPGSDLAEMRDEIEQWLDECER